MNSANIEWNDKIVVYNDDKNYYTVGRLNTDLGRRLGNLLDYIKSQSIHDHFFKKINYDTLCIATKVAEIEPFSGSWRELDPTIRLESTSISTKELYKLVALPVQDYVSKNYSKPSIILIGKELQTAITNGKLPNTRFIIRIPGWYKTVYIPSIEKITVLGEDIIKNER